MQFHNEPQDDSEIVAIAKVGSQEIHISTSPEYEAFLESGERLQPGPMLQQAVWLEQMSQFVGHGVQAEPVPLRIWGKWLIPSATEEAMTFVDGLRQRKLSRTQRHACGLLLSTLAKQLFQIATDRDPTLVPSEDGDREVRHG